MRSKLCLVFTIVFFGATISLTSGMARHQYNPNFFETESYIFNDKQQIVDFLKALNIIEISLTGIDSVAFSSSNNLGKLYLNGTAVNGIKFEILIIDDKIIDDFVFGTVQVLDITDNILTNYQYKYNIKIKDSKPILVSSDRKQDKQAVIILLQQLSILEIDLTGIESWTYSIINGLRTISLSGTDIHNSPFKLEITEQKIEGEIVYGEVKKYDFELKTWKSYNYKLDIKVTNSKPILVSSAEDQIKKSVLILLQQLNIVEVELTGIESWTYSINNGLRRISLSGTDIHRSSFQLEITEQKFEGEFVYGEIKQYNFELKAWKSYNYKLNTKETNSKPVLVLSAEDQTKKDVLILLEQLNIVEVELAGIESWTYSIINGLKIISLSGTDIHHSSFKLEITEQKFEGEFVYGEIKQYNFELRIWKSYNYKLNIKITNSKPVLVDSAEDQIKKDVLVLLQQLNIVEVELAGIESWTYSVVNGLRIISLSGTDIRHSSFKLEITEQKFEGEFVYGEIKQYNFLLKTWKSYNYKLNIKLSNSKPVLVDSAEDQIKKDVLNLLLQLNIVEVELAGIESWTYSINNGLRIISLSGTDIRHSSFKLEIAEQRFEGEFVFGEIKQYNFELKTWKSYNYKLNIKVLNSKPILVSSAEDQIKKDVLLLLEQLNIVKVGLAGIESWTYSVVNGLKIISLSGIDILNSSFKLEITEQKIEGDFVYGVVKQYNFLLKTWISFNYRLNIKVANSIPILVVSAEDQIRQKVLIFLKQLNILEIELAGIETWSYSIIDGLSISGIDINKSLFKIKVKGSKIKGDYLYGVVKKYYFELRKWKKYYFKLNIKVINSKPILITNKGHSDEDDSKESKSHEHPSHEHPSHEHPSHEHPSREHPSREHPSREHPSREHPSREHPSHEHPSREHPSREHPSREHPSREHPSRESKSHEHPSRESKSHELPSKESVLSLIGSVITDVHVG